MIESAGQIRDSFSHGVERGDALRILEWAGAVRQALLSTIFRQQIPTLRSTIYELAHGRTEQGFDKLKRLRRPARSRR